MLGSRRWGWVDCSLAGRVLRPTGHVLVTDIDPRFLMESAALDKPQIEIQRHDIANDPLPEQLFDLIHARLVLFHVPTREQALQRMMTALKPGGWLILDEYDRTLIDLSYPTTDAVASALYQKMFVALSRVMEAHGVDLARGRSLYRRLRALGLSCSEPGSAQDFLSDIVINKYAIAELWMDSKPLTHLYSL